MELLIWAGGRWRRVCPITGRVDGWRRCARVMHNRRGVLTEVPPIPALASAVKGPALPKKRKPIPLFPTVPPSIYQRDVSVQTDTDSVQISTMSRSKCNSIRQTTPQNILSQDKQRQTRNFRSVSTEILEEITNNNEHLDREIQVPKSVDEFYHEHKFPETKHRRQVAATDKGFQRKPEPKDQDKHKFTAMEHRRKLVANDEEFRCKPESNDQVLLSKLSKPPKANAPLKDKPYESQSQVSSEENGTELIINEDDVMLLRHYIEKHKSSIDLYKFDMDDNYKMRVFYYYHPMVKIERCALIAKMLREHDSNITIHFARKLGLQLVADRNERIKPKKNRQAKLIAQSMLTRSLDSDQERKKQIIEHKCIERERHSRKGKVNNNKKGTKTGLPSESSDSSDHEHVSTKIADEISDSENDVACTTITHTADVHKYSNYKRKQISKENQMENDSSDDEILIKKVKKRNIEDNSSDSQVLSQKRKERNVVKKKNKANSAVIEDEYENDIESFKSSKLREKFKQNIEDNDQMKASQGTVKDDRTLKRDKNKENIDTNDKIHLEHKTNFRTLRKFAVPKRSSVRPGREYSSLEDQAIISWLSAATQRERAVNGNRIWKELELSHQGLTGQKRSWHSLRNRYLRYILPGLAGLAIPSHDAQRLRANAAIGELKSGKKKRRNSAFQEPSVLSAFARAPRDARRRGNSESSEAPTRVLRSSTGPKLGPMTPKSQERTQTPTKSTKPAEQTRSDSQTPNRVPSPSKPANRRSRTRSSSVSTNQVSSRTRSLNKSTNRTRAPVETSANGVRTPNKSTNSKETSSTSAKSVRSPNKSTNPKEASSKALQSPSPRSSPTYSELTRRFALRNRSTPERSPKSESAHLKRRLYNPGRVPSSSSLS